MSDPKVTIAGTVDLEERFTVPVMTPDMLTGNPEPVF